ncbi:hypothetical protein MAR_014897, partial [Mya arenaria]
MVLDTKYKITVYTGDKPGAGTDGNVYIILFGENGKTSLSLKPHVSEGWTGYASAMIMEGSAVAGFWI